MPSVLFVCLGNICRSPMCEAVFADLVERSGHSSSFTVDSAGTAGYHIGDTPDERTVKTCKENGVKVNHRARQVCKDDFRNFDYIFCMDESNLRDLLRIAPDGTKNKVQLFGELDPKGERIIQDPYYGGISGFKINFMQAKRCSNQFLAKLGYELTESATSSKN